MSSEPELAVERARSQMLYDRARMRAAHREAARLYAAYNEAEGGDGFEAWDDAVKEAARATRRYNVAVLCLNNAKLKGCNANAAVHG